MKSTVYSMVAILALVDCSAQNITQNAQSQASSLAALPGVPWCVDPGNSGSSASPDCGNIGLSTTCSDGFCTTSSTFACNQVTFTDTTANPPGINGWIDPPNGICIGVCMNGLPCPSGYYCIGDFCMADGLTTCNNDAVCGNGNFCAMINDFIFGICVPQSPNTTFSTPSGVNYTPFWGDIATGGAAVAPPPAQAAPPTRPLIPTPPACQLRLQECSSNANCPAACSQCVSYGPFGLAYCMPEALPTPPSIPTPPACRIQLQACSSNANCPAACSQCVKYGPSGYCMPN